ncbi:MAG TPA: 3-hydroxyacyl-CoA dehydrogenase/enoyl-CoA hydratase family protein [Acidobacteriota bacterium]
MKSQIRKVGVLGAGTMGAQIAAHLANASIPCLLLDRVPEELSEQEQKKKLDPSHPEFRNRYARSGLEFALKVKPAAFFTPELSAYIEIGNFEDDLPRLAQCDWIIEAIVENLEAKRQLLERVLPHAAQSAILSSNTSGIPIYSIASVFPASRKPRWAGTHFFNPPRYMRLVEIIPTADTDPAVVATLSEFCERFLGKQIVRAKDTPNFIANRIGSFAAISTIRSAFEMGLTIEEVDALTGTFLGRPKSATFRLADIVGLDVFTFVGKNLQELLPREKELFELPESARLVLRTMFERKMLGEKTGGGFYRKDKAGGEIQTLDLKTIEYRPRQKPQIPALDLLASVESVGERLQKLFQGAEDKYSSFVWQTVMPLFCYAAEKVPEISETPVAIDDAMRWGYNWELGPFQLWDQIGVQWSAQKWKSEGHPLPLNVERMLHANASSFYRNGEYFDLAWTRYAPLNRATEILKRSLPVQKNDGASLHDLGDGVACLEFHSKMNTLGPDAVEMADAAIETLKSRFDALVVGNYAENFSAGANLMMLLLEIQDENWDDIDLMIRKFQDMTSSIKFASKPVVCAPFGLTLGGGAEICLAARFCQPFAELYMGLVEVGVGLIPAGGGTKELFIKNIDSSPEVPLEKALRSTFETIGTAKVSQSALQARAMNFISRCVPLTLQRSRLIEDAKRQALYLASQAYRAPLQRKDLPAGGTDARAVLELGVHMMLRAGYISEYDAHIGRKLAWILTGGNRPAGATMSEQDMLDLEREVFLSLCGERKTQERIQHMLKTGKPLRN